MNRNIDSLILLCLEYYENVQDNNLYFIHPEIDCFLGELTEGKVYEM